MSGKACIKRILDPGQIFLCTLLHTSLYRTYKNILQLAIRRSTLLPFKKNFQLHSLKWGFSLCYTQNYEKYTDSNNFHTSKSENKRLFSTQRAAQGKCLGTFLVVQWLRLCTSKAKGMGLIPGQGTKIPCVTRPRKLF